MMPSKLALQKTTEAIQTLKSVQRRLDALTERGGLDDKMNVARVIGTCIGKLSGAEMDLEIFPQTFLKIYLEKEKEGRT